MATRLTLIAQGPTAATRRAAFPADEALDVGATSGLVAPSLWRGARVRTSPMLAARQTAGALGLDAKTDAALADGDFGRWAGRALTDIAETDPASLDQWMTDPGFAGHGGESRHDLRGRARGILHDGAGFAGHTLAVTHAAMIRAVLTEMLGAPDSAWWALDIAPLSLTDLRHDGRRWVLRQMGVPLKARG